VSTVVTELRAFDGIDLVGTVVPGPNPLVPSGTDAINNVKFTLTFDAGGGGSYTYSNTLGTGLTSYSC